MLTSVQCLEISLQWQNRVGIAIEIEPNKDEAGPSIEMPFACLLCSIVKYICKIYLDAGAAWGPVWHFTKIYFMTRCNRWCVWVLVACAMVKLPGAVCAQWLTQSIPLQPGWNAVYIGVDPSPARFDVVFDGLPIEGVWMWNKRFSPVEFDVDPEHVLPTNPHWLIWLPTSDPASFLGQTFRLQPHQAYLIKVATDAAPFSLHVQGRAVVPRITWFPHALNLVGFPVNPVAPPTFSELLHAAPTVDITHGFANELFSLDTQGRGRVIAQPNRDRVQPGTAYWVKSGGALQYEGPLSVTTDLGHTLDFGPTLQRLGMTILNRSPSQTYTLQLTQMASETPPSGEAELAGPTALSYLVGLDMIGSDLVWSNMPVAGISRVLGPGETWHIRFGLRRNDLEPYVPAGSHGAAYQSILRLTDAAQSVQIDIPVVADQDDVRRVTRSPDATLDLDDHHSNEGLWVGHAIINEVSCPAYSSTNLLPASSTAGFRLLLHVDASGEVRFLQRIYLAWTGPSTNGAYVLYRNEEDVPPAATDVKRISAVAFPLLEPLVMTDLEGGGNASGLTNQIGVSVALPFNDPVNPFLHAFHPLHDNRDPDFQPYTNAVETVSVVRDISLDFEHAPYGEWSPDPFYGIHVLSGIYGETLHGLRQQPIHVRGRFQLRRVSLLNSLN
jgi:hypothetical protein